MAFKDYSTNAALNTTLGDGSYIGPGMLRNKVRPSLQQIAADGRDLYNEMNALITNPSSADYVAAGTGAVARTISAVLNERPSLKGFFQVPDANYNNAFTKAIAAVNAGEIAGFHIPAGDYRHSVTLPVITRTGAYITGDGKRNSLIKPQGNYDCLTFRSLTPLAAGDAGRIGDLNISGFGIDYGEVTAPTAGVGLTLDRLTRSRIDVEINSAFQGMLVRGGADNHIVGGTISGAYTWASAATGSYIAKFTNYPATTEVPSEWTVGPINWKGSDSKLDNCIIVECCDGLFFSTGHAGFANSRQLWINPQATAGLNIQNLNLGSIYFDGNNAGSASGAGVEISGSTVPIVQGIDLSSATIANVMGKGLYSTLTTLQDLRVVGAQFSNIGKEHIDIAGVTGFAIANNTFRNGNTGNTGAVAVKIASCTEGTINGNRILTGTYPHPVGFDLTSVTDCTFTGNATRVTTTDYKLNSGCDRIAFDGNRKSGGPPSVASVDGMVLPRGFKIVTVTGNANMSNISGQNNTDEVVMLAFTGTASFNDAVGNVYLNGTGGFTATAGSTLILRNDGAKWVEVSRAVI